MTKPRNYQTEAVIIKKVKLGEADRILSLYTPHLGKIKAVAKGVRRPRSKLSGHLELITHSLVSLARGKNLDIITGSQTINSFLPLRSDLRLTSSALYVIELVDQFTADEVENYSLFQLLVDIMHRLYQINDTELTLRFFELHLLDQVGYRPQLMQCVSCHQQLKQVTNYFCSSTGGMLCPVCSRGQSSTRPVTVDLLKVLRFLQQSDYSVIVRLKMNPELSDQLAALILSYLKYLLEREVRTATWLDTLRGKVSNN